jgi:TIR domain-containing protein
MARVFLSHAHEDVDAVEAVYVVLRERLPQHAAWMDRYEIVGGEDLLGKISAGMDEAEKFFVLSVAVVGRETVGSGRATQSVNA